LWIFIKASYKNNIYNIYYTTMTSIIHGIIVQDPITPPVITLADLQVIGMIPGVYTYVYTYANGWGETTPSPPSQQLRSRGAVKVVCTRPQNPNVSEVRIYRASVNDPTYRKIGTISISPLVNTVEYVDRSDNLRLGPIAPNTNTAISRAEYVQNTSFNGYICYKGAEVNAVANPVNVPHLPFANIFFVNTNAGSYVRLPRDSCVHCAEVKIVNKGPAVLTILPAFNEVISPSGVVQPNGVVYLYCSNRSWFVYGGAVNTPPQLQTDIINPVAGDSLVYEPNSATWINADPSLPTGDGRLEVSRSNYEVLSVNSKYVNFGATAQVYFNIVVLLEKTDSVVLYFDLPLTRELSRDSTLIGYAHSALVDGSSTTACTISIVEGVCQLQTARLSVDDRPVEYTISGSILYDVVV
jgi:hypothetical protein